MLTTLLRPDAGTARVIGLDVVRDAAGLRGADRPGRFHHGQHRPGLQPGRSASRTGERSATAEAPYPASKLAAEKELRDSGLTWSILRLGFVYGDGDGHLQSAPGLLANWNWHPAQTLSLVHHRDIATAVQLALTDATDGRTVNIIDEAPMSAYEIAEIVGASYEPSADPLPNPWMGHLDGSLARSLGYRPTVPTVYQAVREGAL